MSLQTFPARATTYNGIKMRSRLEATVAANLDRWGFDWRYEARAFASPEGQYLPDFEIWINGACRLVVEVKGEYVDDFDATLQRMEIAWASEPSALLLFIEAEPIRTARYRTEQLPKATVWECIRAEDGRRLDTPAVFGVCECGTVSIRAIVGRAFLGLCRGCYTERPLVAYLDPTEWRG